MDIPQEKQGMHTQPALVVYCHLRWDFVFQRPQHLISRLARQRRVYFIEEPMFADGGDPCWEKSTPLPGLTVCRPRTSLRSHGFDDAQAPALAALLQQLVKEEQIGQHVAWLYTPLALPLAKALEPQAVVYDCMDELSAFR